ncbi:MAG: hypothetical protein HY040_27630 [Planctomycetes bacterium]|nr:hypothetical protein [Planctomycetota bacterium]
MKLWFGYGSEHSMNLVMIGRFEDARDAVRAKQLIDRVIEKVSEDVAAGLIDFDGSTERFSKEMTEFLQNEKVYNLAPAELEQFAYDVAVEVKGSTLVLRTDECDVSAFLKLLIDHRARVEVFSAHHHPETKSDEKV